MKAVVLSYEEMVQITKGEIPKGLTSVCKEETSDKKYSKFINNYNGKQLLEKHSLDEEGLWKIEGEINPIDIATPNSRAPDIGILQGTLENVIKKAVHLEKFWGWGNGGNVIKIEVGMV